MEREGGPVRHAQKRNIFESNLALSQVETGHELRQYGVTAKP